MFEPRKLIPFSIEYCSAPIAVMTEMTEKTPMVIPIMVRPERNLFTPNEPNAIVMISLNRMTLTQIFHHRDHGDHRVTKRFPQAARVHLRRSPCVNTRILKLTNKPTLRPVSFK